MANLQFKLKTDINGNTKLLDVDLNNKTYTYGFCYRYVAESDVLLSSKEMKKLIAQLEALNFKRVDY